MMLQHAAIRKMAMQLAEDHGDDWEQLSMAQRKFYLPMAEHQYLLAVDHVLETVRELTCERTVNGPVAELTAREIPQLPRINRDCAEGRAGCERIMAMGGK